MIKKIQMIKLHQTQTHTLKLKQVITQFPHLIKNEQYIFKKERMFISTLTLIRYAARKVKVNLAQTQKETSQQQKTKFSDQQLLQMAGFKQNARSTVKIFKQKIDQKAKTNKSKQHQMQQQQMQRQFIRQKQQQDLSQDNEDQDRGSYQKNLKKPKSHYQRFKSPHLDKSQRVQPQEITLKQLSRIRLQPQYLPMHFMQRVKKVFHKYNQQQLRQIAQHFATYTKLRYSEQKIDYEAYEDLGFQKLQYKKPKGGPIPQEPIYLIGRTKMYQERPQDQQKTRKVDQDPLNNDVSYTQNIVISYLLLRQPKTYSVAVRMMMQIRYKFDDFKPKSFIDFGAGLGSGSLAYLDTFDSQDQQVFAVQPAPKMRKMSEYLNPQKVQYFKSLGELSIKVKAADIVYAGYVLNQLDPQLIQVYLQSLWSKVKSQGFLILVQHGNPFGSRIIHQARKWILTKNDSLIAAPCPHHMKCPLARSDEWCHFDQPVGMYPKEVFGKLPNDNQVKNEKFSYLILQKTSLDQFQQAIQANVTQQWDRIVFPLMKKGGHFALDLCTKQGKFQRRVIAKSHGQEYKQGKKLKWGDLWRFGKRIPNKFRKERGTGLRLW